MITWLSASVAAARSAEIVVRADPPRLTWSLFRSVDSLADSEDAHIAAEISFPRPLRVESFAGGYRLPAFTITVAPEPSRTVVRRGAEGSAELLRHEQGHFDIVVLAARALARELASVSASSGTELSQRAEDGTAKHTDRAADLSKAYDRQTDHGRDLAEQRRWSDRIDAALAMEAAEELAGMPL
jgi:hypothetical protein